MSAPLAKPAAIAVAVMLSNCGPLPASTVRRRLRVSSELLVDMARAGWLEVVGGVLHLTFEGKGLS